MASPAATPQVRVGVGCFLFRSNGDFVTGVRKGSHGAGALQLPGGHLDFGETSAACAAREVFEETGLTISDGDIHFVTATNDIFKREGKHYVTLFMACRVSDDVQPRVCEPEKCAGWTWHSWTDLQQLASAPDNDLFLPLQNLVKQMPNLDLRTI